LLQFAQREVQFNYAQSQNAKRFIEQAAQARSRHPAKTILLTGVPEQVVYATMAHDAFRAVDIYGVYLAPGTELRPHESLGSLDRLIWGREDTLRALARGTAVVYDAGGERFTDVTPQYKALAPLKLSGDSE